MTYKRGETVYLRDLFGKPPARATIVRRVDDRHYEIRYADGKRSVVSMMRMVRR